LGFVTTFLSVVVLLPIAALVWTSGKHGWHEFWSVVSAPESVAALKLTLGAAVIVSALNAVLGTITAWVLVRDDFVGKSLMNAVIARGRAGALGRAGSGPDGGPGPRVRPPGQGVA
jgi:sulfate/thiosulfate transport system permease protein